MKTMKLHKSFLFILTTVTILFFVQNSYGANEGSRYTKKSKLSTPGKWVKIEVEDNAIYKLTYEKLYEWGLNPAQTKIYGYGGWMLNEDFSQPYIDDLPEVATWISGSNNTLDPGEFLLFYGRGTVKWSYNTPTTEYIHENNPYSTYGYYFLTDSTPGAPERMQTTETTGLTNLSSVISFDDYLVHEKNEFSISKTGRELFGENFSGKNTQSFPFDIPGITNDEGSVFLSFTSVISTSGSAIPLSLKINNDANPIITAKMDPPSSSYVTAVLFEKKAAWTGNKIQNTNVQIEHPCNLGAAYLNYIRLNVKRDLKYYNTNYTFFRNCKNLTSNIKYQISNANNNLLVFDITDNHNSKIIKTNLETNTLSFNIEKGSIVREFALVDTTKEFSVPQKAGEVETQNLHGLEQIDMAIISPKLFVSEAERLAQAHRNSSRNLKVEVVTPEQIYNEFSSGTPDASAYRRFMKMFYDRGSNENNHPKYLLLFGDGIFDNRFIDPACKSLNKDVFLLTYRVKESLKTDESYLCDDYFGHLDESEDSNKSYGAKKLVLGIGRFPIQNIAQAKSSVNKTLSYMNNKDFGIWKNSAVFLADDSDSNTANTSFTLHMKQADSIANNMHKKFPEYMVTKIYFDAFKPETTGGTKNFDSSAKVKFRNALNSGCLLFNYTGHGGETGLADKILGINDIHKMSHTSLPLWITATCSFGWYDGVSSSAGEEAFLHETSGAIALFTSTRTVYAQDNLKLNYNLTDKLFTKKDGESRPTLGDVIKDGKNAIGSNNNKLSYVLLGDPALTLHYPEYQISVDKINRESVNESPVTIKALESVTVSGHIKNGDNIATDFNGTLMANVFDGIQTMQTITMNTDKKYSYYTDYPNIISPSYCNVENGEFEFTFNVIKDIANITTLGKMNMYAFDPNSGIEAQSSFMNYNVVGMHESANPNDGSAPVIKSIYLNNPTFMPGDIVNETPYFVAEVTDNLGINMSGAGIGHDIQIIIDNLSTKTYNLNSSYKASTTEKNTGTITYSIPTLPEGRHTLTFQVWNILNNVTIEKIDFIVEKGLQPKTYDLTANSNPAKIGIGTSFGFSHNKPEARIEVNVTVFDLSGRPIWSHRESGASELMSAYEIPWDLKNDDGIYVQPGVYVYNATVRSEDGTETTKTKKMIVIGQ